MYIFNSIPNLTQIIMALWIKVILALWPSLIIFGALLILKIKLNKKWLSWRGHIESWFYDSFFKYEPSASLPFS